MAAYASLAFLSLLWGSSFLLIKIAARVFDPVGFALARVGVAAAALLVAAAIIGPIWPRWRPGLWGKLIVLSLSGQVIPFLLLGFAAKLTTSADMALMMGLPRSSSFSWGVSDRATEGPSEARLALRSASPASAWRSRRPSARPPPLRTRSRDARSRLPRPYATRSARSSLVLQRAKSAR